MKEIPGNWELAKAMPAEEPINWRRDQQWQLAETKAQELRSQGYTVTVTAGATGAPVITCTGVPV